MDRAGLVGNDGPTHHGVFDIAYLSVIPNITFAVPKDGNELRSMLHWTVDNQLETSVAIRYPRDSVPTEMTADIKQIEWGTWETLTPTSDITILACGTMVAEALRAVDSLSERGLNVAVVNARFIKPLDYKMLDRVRDNSRTIFTIEEAQLRGGFGEAVGSYLLRSGWNGTFKNIGTPDRFVTHGSRAELLDEVGLDANGLAQTIGAAIESGESGKKTPGLFQKLRFRRSPELKQKVAGAETSRSFYTSKEA